MFSAPWREQFNFSISNLLIWWNILIYFQHWNFYNKSQPTFYFLLFSGHAFPFLTFASISSYSFDKCIWSRKHEQDIGKHHHPAKFPHASGLASPSLTPGPGTTNVFSTHTFLPFQNIILKGSYGLLILAFFTQHDAFETVYTHGIILIVIVYTNSIITIITFCCWLIFHCTNEPWFGLNSPSEGHFVSTLGNYEWSW